MIITHESISNCAEIDITEGDGVLSAKKVDIPGIASMHASTNNSLIIERLSANKHVVFKGDEGLSMSIHGGIDGSYVSDENNTSNSVIIGPVYETEISIFPLDVRATGVGPAIRTNGSVSAELGLETGSDSRIKRDIKDASTEDLLTTLNSIRMRTYSYKDPSRKDEGVTGFIAQQVREVYPEAVKLMQSAVPIGIGCDVLEASHNTVKIVVASADASELIASRKMLCSVLMTDATKINVSMTIESATPREDGSVEIVAKAAVDVSRASHVTIRQVTVPDFHALKKDRLLACAIGSIQALSAKNDALECELKELKQMIKSKLGWTF